MKIVLIVFVVLFVVFFVGIFFLLRRVQQLRRNYGPRQQVAGPACTEGALTWESLNAPTLGKKLRFEYSIDLHHQGADFTGTYKYPANGKGKTIYQGEVFITYANGQVIGRTNENVVEGELHSNGAEVVIGYPAGSYLPRGPFQFSIEGGRLQNIYTKGGRIYLGRDGRLEIGDEEISGELPDFRDYGLMRVKVTYREAAPELVLLAVLLICNDILIFHYD